MEPIYFNQTLRPTRYAFVIKHGDIEAALAAVAINTAIWGGIYNPIVPLEPSEARRGLLEEFDPDTLVNLSGNGLPTDLSERYEHRIISRERVVQTADGRETRLDLGFSMLAVMHRIREKELRLTTEPSRVAVVTTKSGADWEPYTAVVFGTVTGIPAVSTDFKAAFVRELRAREVIFDAARGPGEVMDFICPIEVARYGLRTLGGAASLSSHVIYVGNHQSINDLLEFWNLRATGRTVCFVPLEHTGGHEPMVRRVVEEGHYRVSPHLENHADFQKGSSISNEQFQHICEWAEGLGLKPLFSRSSPPRYGVVIPMYVGDVHAAEIEAQRGEEMSLLHEGRMTPVRLIVPDYLSEERTSKGEYNWSVELTIRGGYLTNEWSFQFPNEPAVERVVRRSFTALPGDVRLSRRGVVLAQDRSGTALYPLPALTTDVFYALFKQAGFTATPSVPGRYAEQIIAKMGSLHFDCRVFKLRGVRDVINRLSNGSVLTKGNMYQIVMSTEQDKFGQNWRPDLYEALILRRGQSRTPEFGDVFDILLEKKVIRPGFTFQCRTCFASDWYHVSEFDEEYTCRFCFTRQRVNFGSAHEWQYRSDGLFRIPDSALGSLAVIVSLWRIEEVHRLGEGRYLSSVLLKSTGSGREYEVDYSCFHVGMFHTSYDLVLGQATGFVDLNEDEVRKMREVADQFMRRPYLVFSTLKDAFSEGERSLLRALAEDGYRVVALTRLELDPYDLPSHAVTMEDLSRNTLLANVGNK